MDIDLLSKMVKDLILDKDEVALPGVGTFVAEMVPASFSDRGYTVNPPYRRLFFRQRTDAADMALADLYAASNGLDREQALQILTDFLTEMKEILKTKKTIVFPGLGRLRATKENNFFFVADGDLDIYPAGYGLEPISLKTHQETPEEVSSVVQGLRSMIATQEEMQEGTREEMQEETREDEIPKAETTAAESPEETVGKIVEDPIEEPIQETVEETVEKPLEETVQEAIEETVEEPVEETIQETVEKPLEEPVEGAVEETMPTKEEDVPEAETAATTTAETAGEENEGETTTAETAYEENEGEATTAETACEDSEDEATTDEPAVQTDADPAGEPAKRTKNRWKVLLYIGAGLLAAIVLALIAFIIISRLSPNFTDSLLYSPEEIELIRKIS